MFEQDPFVYFGYIFQYSYWSVIIFWVLLSFLKTGITFASFSNDGKSPLLIEAIIKGWIKSVNMSAFSLIILVVTSGSRHALEASKQTILEKFPFFPSLKN